MQLIATKKGKLSQSNENSMPKNNIPHLKKWRSSLDDQQEKSSDELTKKYFAYVPHWL